MIALSLSFPPTSNHNTMVANGRRISSPKYRAWRQLAEWEAKQGAKGQTVQGPYVITYSAERPDNRRRDVENLPKSISDALQAAGVIRDDADCECSTVTWLQGPTKGKSAKINIQITPLEAF